MKRTPVAIAIDVLIVAYVLYILLSTNPQLAWYARHYLTWLRWYARYSWKYATGAPWMQEAITVRGYLNLSG